MLLKKIVMRLLLSDWMTAIPFLAGQNPLSGPYIRVRIEFKILLVTYKDIYCQALPNIKELLEQCYP